MYYFFKSFSSIIILLIISLSMQLSIYGEIATAIFVGFVFKTLFPDAYASGGNKWTRTTDLTLIRRVL